MSMPNSKVKYGSQAPARAAKPQQAKPTGRHNSILAEKAEPNPWRTRRPIRRDSTSRHKSRYSLKVGASLFTIYLLHLSALVIVLGASMVVISTAAPPATAEDEVELQLGAGRMVATRRPQSTSSRIYRIRATDLNGRFQLPVHRLAPSRSAQLVSELPPSTTGSPAPQTSTTFGIRSPQRTQSATTPAPSMAPKSAESCSSVAPELDQLSSSVAASSPMLRLTTSSFQNRTISQLVAGEIDQSASVEQRRKRPMVVAAGGSTPQTLLVSSIEPTALVAEREELPATGSQSFAGTWQPSEGVAAESILGLIEEFDSKIITNRTSGE